MGEEIKNTWVDPAEVWDMLVEQNMERVDYDLSTLVGLHQADGSVLAKPEVVYPPLAIVGKTLPSPGRVIHGIAFDGSPIDIKVTADNELIVSEGHAK